MKIDINVGMPSFIKKVANIMLNTNTIYIKTKGKLKLKKNNGLIVKKTDCGTLTIRTIDEYINAHKKGLL